MKLARMNFARGIKSSMKNDLKRLRECFAGSAIRQARFWCALLCFALHRASSAQTTSQILSKVYVARGGLTRIRALRSERVSGTISFGSEASGPFTVELKRPMKMHMTLECAEPDDDSRV